MRNLLLNLMVVLSVFSVQGCWAGEKKNTAENKETTSPGPTVVMETAPAQSVQKESEKAELVQEILSEHKLEVWRGKRTDEEYQFCEQFYQDLKEADPSIHYVEPVLRTDNPDHPGLEHYRTECATREDLPNDKLTYWGLFDVGDKGFRLYRQDFDGNPNNGTEELIYADLSFERKKLNEYGGFAFIDLENCMRTGGKTTRGYKNIGPDRHPTPVNNVNAFIRYHDVYYAMEIYDQKWKIEEPSQYVVELWELTEQDFEPTCIVRWRPKLLSERGK